MYTPPSSQRDTFVGNTCVLIAAAAGSLASVRILVAAGARPDAVNNMGANILHMAALSPDATPELIRGLVALLLEHPGASPGAAEAGALRVPPEVNMPMYPRKCLWSFVFKLARMARRMGTTNRALLLLAGAWKNTPLHAAAGYGNLDTARALVMCGADAAVRGGAGLTPLETTRVVLGGGECGSVKQAARLAAETSGWGEDVLREVLGLKGT
jgi:hypothetical protein